MDKLRLNIKRVFVTLTIIFVIMGGYLVYMAAFMADTFIASPFNPRVVVYDGGVRRGAIYDRHGRPIAYSAMSYGLYERLYPYNALFAHAVGYSGMSRAGLELAYNFQMQRLSFELFQRARHVVTGHELQANSIVTTFDIELQSLLYNGLSGHRGAAVVIEPSTGAIRAMVSSPSFDPNHIEQSWGALSTDAANSPLLNRATQGLYPPGSIFKIVSAAAALNYDPALRYFEFTCHGRHTFGDYVLQCAFAQAHGVVDMRRAMAVSCNGYFAYLMHKIGAPYLIAAAEQLIAPISLDLPRSASQFPMDYNASVDELIQTAIGQGRTLTNPLDMAVMLSAISNGGHIMQPYMVSQVLNHNNNAVITTSPRIMGQVMDAHMAAELNDMLIAVTQEGTGQAARVSGIITAGKTGTAQNVTGVDHSWFIGHAPAENPQVAVAIIIENTGGGPIATQLAGQVFEFINIIDN